MNGGTNEYVLYICIYIMLYIYIILYYIIYIHYNIYIYTYINNMLYKYIIYIYYIILYTYLIVATPLIHAFILGIYKSSDDIWSGWHQDLVGKLLAVEAPVKGRDRFDWRMWILFGWFCSCFSMFFLILRCCFCPCLFVILRCWNKIKRHVASSWFQNSWKPRGVYGGGCLDKPG
jgi:hypothetical protein